MSFYGWIWYYVRTCYIRKGIEVDPAKIEIISALPYLTTMLEVHSFLDMQVSTGDSSRTSATLPNP